MVRPSHAELMAAQESLSQARDIEIAAGNNSFAMGLNNIVLGLFRLAISDEYADAFAAEAERLDGGAP